LPPPADHRSQPGAEPEDAGFLSGDRLIQILAGVAVLLFVSRGVLPRGRGRNAWAKCAKWGAIAVFSAALCYALVRTLLWALAASR
jgi:hypothetical protein